MKQYINEKGLRLVGKAWEIRYQLRKLGGTAAADSRKLQDMLGKPARKAAR
ncbi:Z-ring formation inhibitor MciZ [Paenibacillus tarimensis]|uniref:Z-ring formation inhibitor MciZ n=1 Tax=Paenibacillus tarimensis TaxID=416012 RepID=UPI001F344A90|nr:Z-ring formation inhibitor MciZ [Paenibacillus tarimensis]MCF2942464.1 Z-ring formation inhibitor MciZ [Paenibacillus tarimensis]